MVSALGRYGRNGRKATRVMAASQRIRTSGQLDEMVRIYHRAQRPNLTARPTQWPPQPMFAGPISRSWSSVRARRAEINKRRRIAHPRRTRRSEAEHAANHAVIWEEKEYRRPSTYEEWQNSYQYAAKPKLCQDWVV